MDTEADIAQQQATEDRERWNPDTDAINRDSIQINIKTVRHTATASLML